MKKWLSLIFVLILMTPGQVSARTSSFNWYEIFVRSFQDSDGDGIGDLQGVVSRLDDIEWMGFDGIWLMPVMQSPSYHKYDVTDYLSIDEEYGTLDDMRSLVQACHERGISLIIDLPINHTGTGHSWFMKAVEALKTGDTSNPYVQYYHFSQTAQPKSVPVSGTDWFYEEQFSGGGMPDLNLMNEDVWNEIHSILVFWLQDIGVDGFRLDAVTSYETGNTEKNVELLARFQAEMNDIRPDAFCVGEAWTNLQEIAKYYASGIDAFFLFPVSQAEGWLCRSVRARTPASKFAGYLEDLYSTLPDVTLAPFLSNHDTGRTIAALQARSRPELAKFAELVLHCIGGTVFTYYGEEIGMVGSGEDPNKRLAMYWNDQDMTLQPPGVTKIEYAYPCFDQQKSDEDSLLHYVRKVNLITRKWPEIAQGKTVIVYSDSHVLCLSKKLDASEILLALNFSANQPKTVSVPEGMEIADTLCLDAQAPVLDGNLLTLPPYGFAILK